MHATFQRASGFNADIGGWDMSKVADIGNQFHGATAFNAAVGEWDTSNVNHMAG